MITLQDRIDAWKKLIKDRGIEGLALFEAQEIIGVLLELLAKEWQPIETAPKDGRALLLGYFNSHGKWRTVRGCYIDQARIDEEWEEPENGQPGWYEEVVESDDLPNMFWTTPTHFQYLPIKPTI